MSAPASMRGPATLLLAVALIAAAPVDARAASSSTVRPASEQWPLDSDHFDAGAVWKYGEGAGVTVGVVDSGVAPVTELRGRVDTGIDETGDTGSRIGRARTDSERTGGVDGFDYYGRPGRSADVLGPAEYRRCSFSGSFSGAADRPTVVEGHVFRECTVEGGMFSDLHVRNCTIDTLTCKRMPQVGNCYFEHVTLRNKIGTILFTGLGAPTDDVAAKRREAEMGFYADVDWALDVTELDAAEFSLKGMVPARLVRHDPLTAGVITLGAARSKDRAAVDLTGTYFGAIIDSMTKWSLPDELLVAPRTGPRAESGQRALAELRSRGLLEEPSC